MPLPLRIAGAPGAAPPKARQTLRQPLPEGRAAYLVPARGSVTVNGVALGARDGAGIVEEAEIAITATEDAELVLVVVAAE